MLSSMRPNSVVLGCRRPLGPLGPPAGVTLSYLRAMQRRTTPVYFIGRTRTTTTATVDSSSLVFIANKCL